MSVLFTPFRIKNIQVKNRFIFSACEDSAATDTGMITENILNKNRLLAKNETGMIISTHMSVHRKGRTRLKQLGIYSNDMIPGLRELTDAVHQHNGKIIFQLGHAGIQAGSNVPGQKASGPSGENTMSADDINEVVESFVEAAGRASAAGADGVQIHAAHGYLINEFLSPYYNRRNDEWGGSEENRFRMLGEIVREIKKILPENMILMVKLNTNDYTPGDGVVPSMAVNFASRLAALGIDALEVSCGTSMTSPWNMCRGDIPVKEMLLKFPEEQRESVRKALEGKAKDFGISEGYNLESAKMIRPVMGGIPVIPVGGWRNLKAMEDAVNSGYTELVSMCRPFIMEPNLVKKFRTQETAETSCKNCNRCLAALANNMPVRCYVNGF